MNSTPMPQKPMPLWAKMIICIMALPLLAFPFILADSPADSSLRLFVWFYPAYIIISAICAWMCWRQRQEISWIIIVLMLLTHLAMYYLTNISEVASVQGL